MDAITWLEENVSFEDDPVRGSTYITPEGKFVNLNSIGFEHLDLLAKLEDYGIQSEEDEVIPGLQSNGWIRCNDGVSGYSYLEVREVKPTVEQFEAIKAWVDFVLCHRKEVSIIYLTREDYEEETYGQLVSGSQVVDSIEKVYRTGQFIPASAFESVKEKPKNKKDIPELKIHWDTKDDGYGNKFESYYSDIDDGYVDPDLVDFFKKHGICPQRAQADHNTCSIGFSEKEQKWYGWSHRAIHGFEIGHKCKKGDCGVALASEKVKAPVWYPEPGFKCKTLEDCKKVAIAFADSVN